MATIASPGSYKGTAITGGSDADVAAQIAKIDAGVPLNTPSTLTPDQIGTAPVKIPPITPPTTASEITGLALGTQENTDLALAKQAEIDVAKTEADTSKTSMMESLNKYLGIGKETEKLEQAAGLPELQKTLLEANNNLRASQRAQKLAIEEAEKNREGKFGGALQQEIRDINRKFASEQVDYAITAEIAQGNYTAARNFVDRKVDLMTDQAKTTLDFVNQFYRDNKDTLSKKQDQLFQLKIQQDTRAYEQQRAAAKTLEDTRLATLQMLNENNAPASVRSAVMAAQTPEQILSAAGRYGGDIRGNLIKDAQLRKLNAEINDAIRANEPVPVVNDPTKSTVENNAATLQGIFQSNKVSPANKTTIGNGLALAQAATDLAAASSGGKFAGLYPGRSVVDFFLPEAFKRSKTVSNEALISALDLQTQFWASGAALSDAQTALVQKMIPTKNDTDKAVRTKTNQLVNYMLSQTASRLTTDGITYRPAPVNLFETSDLLGKASPEQLEELRAAGLID